MHYTPPAGNAANFTSGGPYTPLSGDRANLSWEVLAAGFARASGVYTTAFGVARIQVAHTGWLATRFSLPSIPLLATGAAMAEFGTPRWGTLHTASPSATTTFGAALAAPFASSIYSTTFGAPNAPYLQTGVASGIAGAAFGSPRLTTPCRSMASSPSTVVPTAYYATAQISAATGRSTTTLGTPAGTRTRRSGGVLCQAKGFTSTDCGIASAIWRQNSIAAGGVTTNYGTPTAVRGGTRFATGYRGTRFGTPRAQSRFGVRYASGAVTTTLGDPGGAIRNRAASFDITSRFGTPLLTRNTVC